MHRPLFSLVLIAPLVLLGGATAWAQDESPAPAADAPAADAPAADAPGDQEAPAPKGPAAEKFAATYEKWKDVLKELRQVRNDYQTAEEPKSSELRQQWDELVAKATAMLPDLRRDALAAYDEAPNLDSTLTRFLVKLLSDDVDRDDYEAGQQIADLLIKNDTDFKQVYNDAGVIAFVTNDYENAEKYLKAAADANALDERGSQYRALLPEYKELWAKEKEILEAEAKADDLPRVKVETTKGTLVIELFENEAPQTVGNFVHLVESKFYDGTKFHRVLPNFMAQGGDPQGDGRGGPGYNIYDECFEPDHRKHFRGYLSMANTGERDTGGSQFFLTFVPTPHLNGRHTVFGRVIEGMDVLVKLQRIDPQNPASASITPDSIVKAEVLRKRDHEYKPTKVE